MPTYFKVLSTSRNRHTRQQRRLNPKHDGLIQLLGGGRFRLVRGRPLIVTEEQLLLLLDELKQKKQLGLLTVTTPDGREVELSNAPSPKSKSLPPPPPLPHPPLDSVSRDDPWGQPMEAMEGSEPLDLGAGELELPPAVGVDADAPPPVPIEFAAAPEPKAEPVAPPQHGGKKRKR